MRPLLYLTFGISGAAGLFYEQVWSRYLALFLGHSAYAQVMVIAIFLGGMALGALWVGYRSRVRDPLVGYSLVELAVGALGIFFHEIYLGVTGFAHASLFPALAGHEVLVLLVKWTLAAALILSQSVLLGTTFPLMVAGILRRAPQMPGRTLALAYFSNSLGAAIGVLVAGFYFARLAGLPGTLLAAGVMNLSASLVSLLLSRRFPISRAAGALEAVVDEAAETMQGRPAVPPRIVRLLLGVAFGTAVASFAYEIGWLRMLALVLGSSTHSFELMLSAFILWLALGSFWVRRRADRWGDPLRALGIVQWVMGLSALATLPLYAASFHWMVDLLRVFARTDPGYAGLTLARYGICLAIMLPASFFAGMTLPLITRTLLVRGMGEEAIGRVYGLNTLGSIVGVAAAGLVLLPWLGLKGLIVAGAGLDMALGAWVLWAAAGREILGRRLAYAAVGATVLAVAMGALSGGFERSLLVSGVYRYGALPGSDAPEILFYEDGRTATVAVGNRKQRLSISTNGKADASLSDRWFAACTDTMSRQPLAGDEATQVLLPLITLAHVPDARTAAVVGQGSGMSSHMLLATPKLETVVTIEIEPEMVHGSRAFYPANRRVFDDPRSRIVIEDARTYFSSAGLKFDYIFSEPSNPWVSGVASLFTSEYYEHVRRHLADGGVFGQWLQLYEIDDGLVLSVLAAIHQNFDDYSLFLTGLGDALIVATAGPTLQQPDWSVFTLAQVQADLCHSMRLTPETLEATRLIDRRALQPLLDSWPPNSDFYPVLDLLAERSRDLKTGADGLLGLALEPFNFAAAVSGRRLSAGLEGAPALEVPRVQAVARASALRQLWSSEITDSAGLAPGVRAALYRRQAWEAMLRARAAPADWRAWLRDFVAVHEDVTAGTAAYVDARFYAPIFRFLESQRAPEPVRDAVAFRRALDAWEFGEASRLADRLVEARAHTDGTVTPEDLLEGGLVAQVMVGNSQGAKRLYEALGPFRTRGPSDLRSQLVDAYLKEYTEGAASPPLVSNPSAKEDAAPANEL